MSMTLLICNASIKREVLTKNQMAHDGKDRASLHSDYEYSCRIVSDGSIWRFSPHTPDAHPK